MNNFSKKAMSEEECSAFDDWWAGIKACDTDEDFEAKREAGEAAAWWAVGSFGISYVDVIQSWVQTAAWLIDEGMDA